MKNIKLYPHNQETYDKIQELWKTENKVAAVQATGTGKSYLILKCIYNVPDVNKVLLAPSNYILEQIENEVEEILPNTKTMTYSKLSFMSDDEIKELNVNYIFLDEFHRCGAEQWGDGVQRLLNMFPDAKILGTSATHIRFLDNARNMGEELFNGNIVNNISLAEAIVRNILPMPKYISALYTFDDEVNNLKTKVENSKNDEESKKELLKQIEIMKRKLDKSKGIPNILKKHLSKNYNGKFIIFCKDKIHLDEMKEIVIDWFKQSKVTKEVDVYSVYSNYEYGNAEVEAFINNKNPKSVKLLFSIEMFNEGIHIEDVTGVILLRPTVSPIIYYQQIGRAMQTGKDNSPVIFDLVNNFDNIGAKNFIGDLEKEVKLENKKRDDTGDNLNDGKDKGYVDISEFMIFDETLEAMNLFEDIEGKLIDNWDAMYEKLNNFYLINGHSDIVRSYKDAKLAMWISNQRACYNKGLLDDKKIEKLERLNFSWSINDLKFNTMYNLLKNHVLEFGNCLIDHNDTKYKDIKLEQWIKDTRKNKGILSKKRISMLEEIGFVWSVLDHNWMKNFNNLKKYLELNDNIYPSTNNRLYFWVKSQRDKFIRNKLTLNQIDKLKEIGFIFEIDNKEILWMKLYEQYKQVGMITTSCKNKLYFDKELYQWEFNNRRYYKIGKLDNNKIELLNKIGFIWKPREYVDDNLSMFHIKNLLIINGLRQKDLSDILSISTSAIRHSCLNTLNIPQKYIDKIANYFNIEPYLLQPQKGDGCVKNDKN
jgi:superfamily II DNA or RNA helicase